MKSHEICVLPHTYIFNINVKYTLHLVQLIIQIDRQDTKEKLQTSWQINFCTFCSCGIFLINQTLKEKYAYCTGSRNLYRFLNYYYTGPRNIPYFLTISLRLYFIVNHTYTIYILLFLYLFSYLLQIFLLSIFYLYVYSLSLVYMLILYIL